MNAPPPFSATSTGNLQMSLSPNVAPVATRMKAPADDQPDLGRVFVLVS